MPATWIEASRSPVVPGTSTHAMAATPLFLFVVWWSWTTLFLMIAVSICMVYLQIKGRNPAWVFRRTKGVLRGPAVVARPVFYRRRRARIESWEDLDIDAAFSLDPTPLPHAASAKEGRKAAPAAGRPGGAGRVS